MRLFVIISHPISGDGRLQLLIPIENQIAVLCFPDFWMVDSTLGNSSTLNPQGIIGHREFTILCLCREPDSFRVGCSLSLKYSEVMPVSLHSC